MPKIILLLIGPLLCSCSTIRRNKEISSYQLSLSEVDVIKKSVSDYRKIRGDYAVAVDTADRRFESGKNK